MLPLVPKSLLATTRLSLLLSQLLYVLLSSINLLRIPILLILFLKPNLLINWVIQKYAPRCNLTPLNINPTNLYPLLVHIRRHVYPQEIQIQSRNKTGRMAIQILKICRVWVIRRALSVSALVRSLRKRSAEGRRSVVPNVNGGKSSAIASIHVDPAPVVTSQRSVSGTL